MSRREIFIFLVIFRNFHTIFTFNIDVENVIIYHDPTNYFMKNHNRSYDTTGAKNSFFGTSVLLYPGDDVHTPWIQIGAPRADSPNVKYKNPGTIYRCPINERCEFIEIDKEYGEIDNRNGFYINKLDGAWIGSVMDINLRTNRSVVCAPRWMRIFTDNQSRRDFRMLGACYWSYLNSKEFHKKLPLLGANDVFTDSKTKDTVYNYGQGEAGFSVHFPEYENELLLGAPGIYNWKGSTLLMKDRISNENDSPVASKLRTPGTILDHEVFNEVRLANARKNSHLLSFGLFGYSVTSGRFFSRMNIHYASGAPRSKSYRGEVLIYDFQKIGNDWMLDVKNSLQGVQFGEYFGASLTSGDLDGDGYDDLFVGAPFRKNSIFNEGRVYLYFGSNKSSFKEPVRGKFVDGSKTNSQFGTSLIFLGDMNRDETEKMKNKYVAISAPYEDEGAGVVYIYTGNSMGFNLNYVQKIEGKSIDVGLRGFGMSISKPADVDGNGYDDLAIGAYKSGHVVLLRSKPLVKIISYFENLPSSISNEIREFEVVLCHRYYSYRGLQLIEIARNIVVDEDFNRAYLDATSKDTQQLVLEESKPSCEKLKIKFRDSWPNAYDPLTLKVTHSLIEKRYNKPEKIRIKPERIEGTDQFCMRCGVYDSTRSVRTIVEHVPFVLGCANDAKCISELNFACKFQGVGIIRTNTFILGASNVIELVTDVENKGEKAYLLRVQVDLPNGLSFRQIPTQCDQNRTRISCPVANPLDKNEKKSLTLKLDMDIINRRIVDDFLFINVTLLTNSENKNRPSKMVVLNLKTEADVSISGKSGEQSYSYGKSKEKIEFQQIFQIAKYGLSPVTLIRFEIFVPYALRNDKPFVGLYEPEGHVEGGQSLMFDSDAIVYLSEEDSKVVPGTIQDVPTVSDEIRNRRNVEFFSLLSDLEEEENFEADLLGNRTFKIDCNTTEGVRCEKIVGTFDGSKKSAIVQLRMVLDTKILGGILPKNAIIRFVTRGFVTIVDPPNFAQSGKRPDSVSVSSFFVNDSDKKKIELWIIVLSVVFGILLLLFVILCLFKAGFFKRSKKEELEQLKAQTSGNVDSHEQTT